LFLHQRLGKREVYIVWLLGKAVSFNKTFLIIDVLIFLSKLLFCISVFVKNFFLLLLRLSSFRLLGKTMSFYLTIFIVDMVIFLFKLLLCIRPLIELFLLIGLSKCGSYIIRLLSKTVSLYLTVLLINFPLLKFKLFWLLCEFVKFICFCFFCSFNFSSLGAKINFFCWSFLLILDKMMLVIKSLFKHWGLPFFGIILDINYFSNINIPFFSNIIKLYHFFLWVVWWIFII
jgi:hypothetical protein